MSLKNVTGDWFGDRKSYIDFSDKPDIPTSSQSFDSKDSLEKELVCAREKNRILQLGWRELERNCNALQEENEKLIAKLAVEKQKSLKYFNKLKYIQDNQEVFNRLKQAYLSLKYNESLGRPLVEIREKSCQTWQAIICDACLGNKNATARDFVAKPSGTISVYKKDIDQVTETVSKLKVMINNREDERGTNREREEQLRVEIKNLEYENRLMQNLISLKVTEMDHIKTSEAHKVELSNRELLLLKKIIFKQERRLREIEKHHKPAKPPTYPLNNKEKELVDLIYSKYMDRIDKKNTDPRSPKMKALKDKESKIWKKSSNHQIKKSDNSESETPSVSSQQSIQ